MNYDIVEREDVEEEEEITEESAKVTSFESFTEQLDRENPNWRQEAEEEERKQQESIKNLQDFIEFHAGQFWSGNDIPEESELVYDKCIEFLDALIKDSKKWTYLYPIWKGLRKIKDKGTLLQMYAKLVQNMWT